MNPIASHASPTPIACGVLAGSRSFQAEQTTAGILSEKQSTDLTITTVEGDTVTLSLATAMEATAGTYHRQSLWDGGRTSSQTAFFEFSSSRSLVFEIDGDLSEDEMADIREAVKTIGSMIDRFLAVDVDATAEDAQPLKELGSIADLHAAFTSERQVVYAERESVELRNGSPIRYGHGRGHGRLRHMMNRIDRLTDDMAEQVNRFAGRRKHLAKSVERLLGRYHSGMAQNAPADDLGRAAIRTVQSVFTQKMQTVTESTGFNLSYAA